MSDEQTALFADLPEILQPSAGQAWERYQQALHEAGLAPPLEPGLHRGLIKVFALSEFAAGLCAREPHLFADLCRSGDLFRAYRYGEQLQTLAHRVLDVGNEAALQQVLREYRQREMLRISFRDLLHWNDLRQTTHELSWLAEACLETALGMLSRWQQKELGRPCDAEGRDQSLVVVGMGKLGARELNYSSDIDLILAYPEEGTTRGGRVQLDNSEYFTRLGRRLINALDAATAEGFVFRVDMRLRPFGESGPLAMSFDAFEEYYQTHGREWERYAMIKARVVAGDRRQGAQLLETLRPFVYRRYIDFGVFESLREMKQMIERQVARKGMANNVKLGAGGIREVEFIGQAFQLIHGGRYESLRQRPILKILQVLEEEGMLPGYVVTALREAYIFLRNTEHRLQMWRDEQTHKLPSDAAGQARLALAMDCADWQVFSTRLAAYRRQVDSHFRQVFAAPQGETQTEASGHTDLQAVWQNSLDTARAEQILHQAGYQDVGEILRRLGELRDSYACRALSAQGRQRMDRLMPLLLGAAGTTGSAGAEADMALIRVLGLIEQIARRTAYLSLLVENPIALSQLVRLCAASPWITEQLSNYPLLLDELIDVRSLYQLPKREQLQAELDMRFQGVDEADLERHMDILRQFKQANVLRVAAADVTADMPLMQVSDHLTEIAEVCLQRVLDLAWQHMVRRHGRPPSLFDGKPCDPGFAVLAYGKLGGIELGYGSDLDIVFLHAGVAETVTDGKQPIDSTVFFARLAQRMTHLLNTQTTAGILYEVDLRLRPSGASGLLVSDLEAFRTYQQAEAWTWEHQALVRARKVAGDERLGEGFAAVRREVLARPRETAELVREVVEMRARMRSELGSKNREEFDLKQDLGGIVDIEFMVQYAVLQWSVSHPQLLEWTDNIRLLETLVATGLLAEADGAALADAYRAYRAEVHRLKLQAQPARVPADRFVAERQTVQRLWQAWLGS
ncbi:bifunctional [glutamate--ammonia ligase]-adenylyl-L-tyrosine phosphorylase/[glutamate--ammonia-ligase] adenylyltransferase [Sulfuriflexus mobilis]|uniref:bifunctional [glutamate--ammonia ligase]-adenylyl-L-tyrosine phosphorylase/[glutamate--ammonia-ligase] adenylyltransferase n=1 Tax=Sulfuriflexus mobilis TaxID=1811807 RepID=UPI000F82018B|nr:bifunctional [glutamate--ammonia ligase]-adenylyl-L-tyrosine phosphorylase/[glutamate--ammonia-ligase] adenylyltransferase [Sulfuriflexus mobilis]